MQKHYKRAILMSLCLLFTLVFASTAGAVAADGESSSEVIGQWPGSTPGSGLIGTVNGTDRIVQANGLSGEIFYKMPINTDALEAYETYQIVVEASISRNTNYNDGYGGNDPVVFDLTLYQDKKNPIASDLKVQSSSFGDKSGTKEISFLFTRPTGTTGENLCLHLDYKNGKDKNPYDMTLKQVTLNHVPVSLVTAEMIVNSTIINSAVISKTTSYDSLIQNNDNLICEDDTGMSDRISIRPGSVSPTPAPSGPDSDEDGIVDDLERNGYVYDEASHGIKAWNGDTSVKYYKTDPQAWSTDGDPYSDGDEVLAKNIGSDIVSPADDPMIPALPIIGMQLNSYTVTPKGDITRTDGSTVSQSFSETTSNRDLYSISDTIATSVTVECKATFGVDPSAEASVSTNISNSLTNTYETESTKTKEATNGSEKQWEQATSTKMEEAADLALNVTFKNIGSATVDQLQPVFNVKMGDDILATIQADQVINTLGTPKSSMNSYNCLITKDSAGNSIALSMDKLRALQCGAPLSIEPQLSRFTGKVNRWNPDNHTYSASVADWIDYMLQINACTSTIHLDMGDGTIKEYPIYAGAGTQNGFKPELTLEQALMHVTALESRNGVIYIADTPFPEGWAICINNSDPNRSEAEMSTYITNQLKENGNNIAQVVLLPKMDVFLRGPKAPSDITVPWAHILEDNDKSIVEALVVPGYYHPVTSVEAEVWVNGVTQTVSLDRSDKNNMIWTTTLATAPEPKNGTILVNRKSVNGVMKAETEATLNYEEPGPSLYVPLATPKVLGTTSVNMGSGMTAIPLKGGTGTDSYDYTGADSYVLQVINNRWSTDYLEVSIEGRKVNMGTGDSKSKNEAGATYSPVHSTCIVIPRPTDGRTSLNFSWVTGAWCKCGSDITVKLLGYFQKPPIKGGGLFELIATPPKLTCGGLNSLSNLKLDSGKPNAKAYLVKATASRLSSDIIGVNVNEVQVDLGSSDSHKTDAGAVYSPIHSETFFVPADSVNPGILKVSTDIGAWNASHFGNYDNSNDAKIEVEVLGYFGDDGRYSYSDAYTHLDLDNNTKTLSATTYNQPKAYLVLVTDNRINSDIVRLTINNASSDFGASNTVDGAGDNPNVQYAAIQSHLMLVPVNLSNPLQLNISQQSGGWKNNGGDYTVEVLGYFH